MKRKVLLAVLLTVAFLALLVVAAKATDSEAALEGVTEIDVGSELIAESETATELQTEAVTEQITEMVTEAVGNIETELATDAATEIKTEQIPEDTVPGGVIFPDSEGETVEIVDFGEVKDIIDSSESLSEAILRVAEKWGISLEKAEKLVGDIKAWGDEHLAENKLWQALSEDIAKNPAGYILFAVVLLLLVTVVGFLARGVVSNMGQMRSIKINQGQIKEALLGDDDGDGKSLKALMTARNKEIDDLRAEMAVLRESVDAVDSEFAKVNKSIDGLSETVGSMKADTKKAADISLESGLQLTQLISIAMERKIPIVSDDARKMWYDHSRAKLLERAGVSEEKNAAELKRGGEASSAEPGEKI